MPGDAGRRDFSAPRPGPPTFFLSGYYGQGNLGDDLLLRATIEGICRVTPARCFIIRNENDIAGLNDLNVPIVLTGIDRIAADQTKSKPHRLVSTLLAYRQHFRQCDWFVFGGGTVFHERSSVIPLAMTFLICLLARVMRVRVAALGVGISMMQTASGRILLRMIVAMSEVFAVRDDAALAECEKAGAGSRVVLTSDLVYTMSPQLRAAAPQLQKADVPLIGVSVYAPALAASVDGDRVMAAMVAALEAVLARGWRIALLAFHHPVDDSSTHPDFQALVRLTERFPDQYRDQVTQKILRADDIAGIAEVFSRIDLHCGMRFHGHVLSAIFGKSFVGITVDNKTDAICRLFGMPVVQIKDFSSDGVIRAMDQAVASHIDPSQRASCEDAAADNFSQLADRLSAVRIAA